MTPASGGTETMSDSIFIDVEVAPEVASDPEMAAKLTEVCPVDIYGQNEDGTLKINEDNLDECVLCELCVTAAPAGKLRVLKKYDGTVLERS
jgi:ferredoxin-like protein FixX